MLIKNRLREESVDIRLMAALSTFGSSLETLVERITRTRFAAHSTKVVCLLSVSVRPSERFSPLICHLLIIPGAHLPGFATTGWQSGSACSPTNVGISKAGITAYRTTFSLNLPAGSDIPVALKFKLDSSTNYRSTVFINGWQFGRFNSRDGPQDTFPVGSLKIM
jgi:hypothetical protein